MKTSQSGRLAQIMGLGARMVGESIKGTILSRPEIKTRLEQAKLLTEVLAEMKGAAMKFGQILSIQGEHLLPQEVTDVLSKLQNAAPAFSGQEMKELAQKSIGSNFDELVSEFDLQSLASASIGQVHKVKLKDQRLVAMKIQYPGVEKAIDAEVAILKKLIKLVSKVYVENVDFDPVMEEIKGLLKQEVDYKQEAQYLEFFAKHLNHDTRYRVPLLVPELSTQKVISMSFEEGVGLKEFLTTAHSKEHRNKVGYNLVDLFHTELYKLRTVQTDPNFANYKFRSKEDETQIVLLDFGACKSFSEEFMDQYKKFVAAVYLDQKKRALELAHDLKFLTSHESEEVHELFYKMCRMSLEPIIQKEDFDFGNSNLPKQLQAITIEFLKKVRKTAPPKDIIFLNRKLGGLYNQLRSLNVSFNFRVLLERDMQGYL